MKTRFVLIALFLFGALGFIGAKDVFITSNDNMTENDSLHYSTNYSFMINAPDFNSLSTEKCTFEILTNDGNNYEIPYSSCSNTFPYTLFINIPNASSLPSGYDWAKYFNGMLKARIHFAGLDADDNFRRYEADFDLAIPYKPTTPKIGVKSIEDTEWEGLGHVTLEFSSYGAEAYYLTYEPEGFNYTVPYYIVSNPDSNGATTCTFPSVFLFIANYFSIVAINQYGKSESTLLTLLLPTDIDSKISNTNFNVYPNPAKDIITIKTPESNNNQSVIITDMQGRKCLQVTLINTDKIDISRLPQGNYLLHIEQEGKRVFTTKLMKK